MQELGSQRHHSPGSDFDSQALAGDKRDRRELRRTSRRVQHAKMLQDCTGRRLRKSPMAVREPRPTKLGPSSPFPYLSAYGFQPWSEWYERCPKSTSNPAFAGAIRRMRNTPALRSPGLEDSLSAVADGSGRYPLRVGLALVLRSFSEGGSEAALHGIAAWRRRKKDGKRRYGSKRLSRRDC
jgi:hypothetical protein